MARKILTGDVEIEKTLKQLADKAADRVARNALGAALTVVAKVMKKTAPVGTTGSLKASIGKRNEKGKRRGIYTAKAGINVGKRSKKTEKRLAPHSHLVALGTKPRFRKSLGGRFAGIANPSQQQLSTGVMPSNDFIKRAYESSREAAQSAMRRRAEKSLARELEKAKKQS